MSHRYRASWRDPLIEAFRANGNLTADQIAAVICQNSRLRTTGSDAVVKARCSGMEIVVVGAIPGKRGKYKHKLYELRNVE